MTARRRRERRASDPIEDRVAEEALFARRRGNVAEPKERLGETMHYAKAEEIIAQPEDADRVHMVLSGAVRTTRLLSDGRRTTGVDTLEAAKMAADRGVRIYVVGLGTPDGHTAMGEGMAMYLQLDEPTLRHVAQMTGGEYHHAGTAEALRSVYQKLGSRLQVSKRDTELTALLACAAAILVMAGAGLSLLWFGRVA